MFEGPTQDRLAIRERIEAYSDAVFRHDAEAWIDNWADGAVWSLPGFEVTGKPAIKAAWLGAMSSFRLAAFFSAPGAIVVDGLSATARVWTQEVLITTDGAVRRIVGAYDDRLINISGAWLFHQRRYAILHDQTGA